MKNISPVQLKKSKLSASSPQMGIQSAKGKTQRNRFMEAACEYLPNCSKAMSLVETGCERNLRFAEKVALKYHGRLCPFCACATGKFESGMNRMREAQAARRSAPHS
jgi:hypothetical protein